MFVCAANEACSLVLFQAAGSSSSFNNIWPGWYNAAPTVTSGPGKRAAYDTLPVSSLRLSDGGGRFVEYQLNAGYAGRTLLSIVKGCMGSSRQNTGSSAWRAGLCSNVGRRTSSSSASFGSFSLSSVLRIGVGDGQVNSDDWALLMPLSGNGNGDYNGNSAWAFGGEDETNNGYSGTVAISATCAGRSFTHHCLRALSPDVRISVRVRHDGPARGAIFVDFFVSLDGGALYYVCRFCILLEW